MILFLLRRIEPTLTLDGEDIATATACCRTSGFNCDGMAIECIFKGNKKHSKTFEDSECFWYDSF